MGQKQSYSSPNCTKNSWRWLTLLGLDSLGWDQDGLIGMLDVLLEQKDRFDYVLVEACGAGT